MNAPRVVGAGAFVVLGLLLFTAALFMIGDRRMLFQDRMTVYTEFARLGQLEAGATVRVAGMEAGDVAEIHIPNSPSGKFRVKMNVRKDVHQLIRADSVATTQTEGLVGAIFVNIAAGSEQAPQVPEGGTIPGREPFLIADLMEQASGAITLLTDTVESLRDDLDHTVQQIASTTDEAHAMLVDIRPDITAISRNGNRISSDTRDILAAINQGKGTLGKLVHDDTLYQRAREIAESAGETMANVKQVSEEARRALADFRSADGPAQGLIGDMRVTLAQAREATADLADNMEALKRNFLLRGFFNKRGYFDLDAISPAEYRKGVLEKGNRKAMRIWLDAGVLFERLPDHTEKLSSGGRARLDSAVATYLPYVPTNPLVIEGYATDGPEGELYRRARIRAEIVRVYLLDRYELPLQHVGVIALGDSAQGSPRGGKWDGVAVTLFLDRDELKFAQQQTAH